MFLCRYILFHFSIGARLAIFDALMCFLVLVRGGSLIMMSVHPSASHHSSSNGSQFSERLFVLWRGIVVRLYREGGRFTEKKTPRQRLVAHGVCLVTSAYQDVSCLIAGFDIRYVNVGPGAFSVVQITDDFLPRSGISSYVISIWVEIFCRPCNVGCTFIRGNG